MTLQSLFSRVAPLGAVLVVCVATTAYATPPSDGGEPPHENHYVTGAFGSAYLVVDPQSALHGHYGGGVFFEAHVVPHYLAIELGVQVLVASPNLEVPFDLLFKYPAHVTPWCELFIGVGPTFVPVITDGGTLWHFGAAIAGGAYWWVHPHVAILTALNYNIIANHGAQHEIGLMVGPAYGF